MVGHVRLCGGPDSQRGVTGACSAAWRLQILAQPLHRMCPEKVVLFDENAISCRRTFLEWKLVLVQKKKVVGPHEQHNNRLIASSVSSKCGSKSKKNIFISKSLWWGCKDPVMSTLKPNQQPSSVIDVSFKKKINNKSIIESVYVPTSHMSWSAFWPMVATAGPAICVFFQLPGTFF